VLHYWLLFALEMGCLSADRYSVDLLWTLVANELFNAVADLCVYLFHSGILCAIEAFATDLHGSFDLPWATCFFLFLVIEISSGTNGTTQVLETVMSSTIIASTMII